MNLLDLVEKRKLQKRQETSLLASLEKKAKYFPKPRVPVWIPKKSPEKSKSLNRLRFEHYGFCSGRLLKKEGKYGKFIGCSLYPQCKFTTAIVG